MVRVFILLFILYAAVSSVDFAVQVAEQEERTVVPCDTDSDCLAKNPQIGE